MIRLPKSQLAGAFAVLAALTGALTSCNSTSSTPFTLPGGGGGGGAPSPVPTTSASSGPTTSPSTHPSSSPTTGPTSSPTTAPTTSPQSCTLNPSVVPGTYTTITAIGNVASAVFTSISGSSWSRSMYTAATPAPTISPTALPSITPSPSPSVSPTTTPSPQPVFLYQGVYTVVRSSVTETTGCATLIASQGGEPLSGAAYNAANFDAPYFNQLVNSTFVTSGTVTSMTISNLSASGGSGPFTLSDGSTGTVTLTSRTAFPSAAAAQAFIHHR